MGNETFYRDGQIKSVVQFQKYPYRDTPSQEGLEFSGGGRGSVRPNKLHKCNMKLD